ncbi:MAG: LysR family transcriptional regulator [Methylophilaceae bacterium]|nr:LysR family transcriptional regulator [Methylophilaceae bacterium]
MLNRLDLLQIFYTAAESTSFKKAAYHFGRSPQTITRAVKDLEENLGELLLHRNTRQIRLTEFGSRLIELSRKSVNTLYSIFRRIICKLSLKYQV